MSDPERFDGDDGVTLGYLSSLAEPDYRAKYAELAAQVRYLADELLGGSHREDDLGRRLYALVGPWPHERKP